MLETTLIGLFVIIVVLFSIGQYVKIYKYNLSFDELSNGIDGLKILHISDWHNRKFGKRIVRLVNHSGADMILVTGDCVLRDTLGTDTFLEFLDYISLDIPIYVSFGNHELGIDRKNPELDFLNSYKRKLEMKGVAVLDNAGVNFVKGDCEIAVFGLTIPLKNYTKLKKLKLLTEKDITSMIGKKPNKFTILLAHTPENFEGYSDWGAELCLCGHNHGGIINIPLIGGMISASLKIFPKYDKGVFRRKNSVMVLNRGTGNNGANLRFLNNPEIGLITIEKNK